MPLGKQAVIQFSWNSMFCCVGIVSSLLKLREAGIDNEWGLAFITEFSVSLVMINRTE